MFWKSIVAGLGILGHWQVWIAALLYMAITFAFLIIASKISGEDESVGGRAMVGCTFHAIGGAILHGVLMGIMVAFLLPILLGGSSAAPISGVVALLWPIVKIGVIAFL